MRVISTNSGRDRSQTTAKRLLAQLSLALVGLAAPLLASGGSAVPSPAGAAPPGGPIAEYARLPLSFELNQGQTDRRVKFLARGEGYTLFLAQDEAVLVFEQTLTPPKGHSVARRNPGVVRLKLVGAGQEVRVSGVEESPAKSNYFIGNDPRRWRTAVPNYAKVRYSELYPGVDLVYYGHQGRLEYDFELGPSRDVSRIRLGIEGTHQVEVDRKGDLVLRAGDGEVRFEQPVAYQMTEGRRRNVQARYVLGKRGEVGFKVGEYDHRLPLIIDPVLAYATYVGGTGGDVAYGVAVDSSGNTYIAGVTNSTDFPVTTGVVQGSNSGNGDAFVVKINSAAEQSSTTPKLVYSTYLGGQGSDVAAALAVDATGDVFITGSTNSSNFPIAPTGTTPPFQNTYGGNGDAFVAELSSTGANLLYSSYLGGQGADFGQGIAVDGQGQAYVVGSTTSNDLATVSPFQQTSGGGQDAFVAKVNFGGTQLLYSTYLGGAGADVGQAIAVNSAGNAYVTGYTFSANFPTLNPYQSAIKGATNAFVTELDPAGSSLVFSTYLGGDGNDRAFGIALDSGGNVYVTGESTSSTYSFPTTSAALQSTNHGASDAFVSKLNPGGTNLVYSTLLGGSDVDQANAIAVDSSGDAFVTGFTRSSDFPTQSAVQGNLGISGGSTCGSSVCADAFVGELNPSGSVLTYSTYLGGSGLDIGQAIALDSSGDAFVAGSTASTNFPAIYNASQSGLASVAGNAFAAEITAANNPGVALVPQTLDFGNQPEGVASPAKTVQLINEGTAPLTISTITFSVSYFAESDNCVGTVPASGGTCTISVTYTPTSVGASAPETISINDNAPISTQLINLKGSGVAAATAVTLAPTSLSFGNQNVGTVSAPQTLTITNTGTSTLTITPPISISANFAQTNTCNATNYVLNVGQSCTVSVSFQPTASGALNGSVSIADNASGSPQSVALSGTGLAIFSLSSPSPTTTISVGSTTGCPSGLTASCATFKISAAAPSSFTGNITLSCGSSALTCSFNPGNPANVLPGQTSTLTLSGLTASTVNPLNFTVNGTSGSQTATLNLTVLMADFSLSASPALDTIVSGAPAPYTILVTPSNGFNQQVNLSCNTNGLPPGATCTFSQSSVTPSGSPASVTLTVNTTKTSSGRPRFPFRGPPPPSALWLAALATAALMTYGWRRRRATKIGRPLPPRLSWGLLAASLAFVLLSGLTACRSALTTTATTTGNYTITINGTLNSNPSVVRSTVVNLAVT